MRRLIATAGVTGVLLLGGLNTTARAEPNEHAPHGGTGSHPHHVHKGNGECHEINQVHFEPDDRGMHRAANSSNGHDSGPYHGPCH